MPTTTYDQKTFDPAFQRAVDLEGRKTGHHLDRIITGTDTSGTDFKIDSEDAFAKLPLINK